MSINEIKVPFISYDEIRIISEDFLHRHNTTDEIPVPIDKIVEMNLSIEIIPIHELKNAFNIDGYVSNNFKTITVDQYVFENIENRYRFTLAHEIVHIILHKPIFEQLGFTNEEEWKYMITAFDTKQYGNLETQANRFAALILVPRYHLIEKYNDTINKVARFTTNLL